jgi:chaperone BCS1
MPNFYEPLKLGKDIYFQLVPPAEIASGSATSTKQSSYNIEQVVFNLYTTEGTIEDIHDYVKELVERYEHEKKNRLGNEIYYFDMVVEEQKRGIPQKAASFRKSRFHTNRRLEHVYFTECAHLRRRLDFFMNRKDWYDRKGIPHTLGIVMYGVPGCGKTSTIKAIANETKRHIFNVLLSEIKTKEALKNLFFNDVVMVHDGEMAQTLNIPVRNRIYIIEDIDRMESVVLKGASASTDATTLAKREELEKFLPGLKADDHDKLDLATLLNVLDGVRETPGRIIILSTNHPERLDEALLRPGRFDLLIHFKKHERAILKQHVAEFYDAPLTEAEDQTLSDPCLDDKWTPAEVSQVLFKYIDDRAEACRVLVEEDPVMLFSLCRAATSTTDIASTLGLSPV